MFVVPASSPSIHCTPSCDTVLYAIGLKVFSPWSQRVISKPNNWAHSIFTGSLLNLTLSTLKHPAAFVSAVYVFLSLDSCCASAASFLTLFEDSSYRPQLSNLDFLSVAALRPSLVNVSWTTTSSLISLNSASFIFLYMYSDVLPISKLMHLIGFETSLPGYV